MAAPPRTATSDRSSRSSWLWNFWGGLSPRGFLRRELKSTSARRIGALRTFAALMLSALVFAVLGPFPLAAIAGSLITSYSGTNLDGTSLASVLMKLMAMVAAAAGLAELTLAMWADQPWFLLPWVAALITLMLFHVQVTGASAIPAALFVASVLYHPESATVDQYTALWTVVVGALGCGSVFVSHWTLWPETPADVLHRGLRTRFDQIERVLWRLSRYQGPSAVAGPPEAPAPGTLSGQLAALSALGTKDPALALRQDTYLELIIELDTWFNIVTALAWELRTNSEAWAPDEEARARLRTLAVECGQLRQGLKRPCAKRASERGGEVPAPVSGAAAPAPVSGAVAPTLLHLMAESAKRVRAAVEALRGPRPEPGSPEGPSPDVAEAEAMPIWLTRKFWLENAVPLHFGFKYALGVIFCLLLVQGLDWPGIDTAMMTCLVIAGPSLGADYRKSILRLLGAGCGGLFAYVFIIVEQPAITTLAGFLLAAAPVYALGAWIAAGGPRSAYFGAQLTYAFNNVVLVDAGPTTDLTLARDRVLGVLVGIGVMWLIDYLVWPHRAKDRLRKPLGAAVLGLREFIRQGGGRSGPTETGAALIRAIDGNLNKTLDLLEQASLEPGAEQPEAEAERARVGLIAGDLHRIARILQSRRRSRLGPAFEAVPDSLKRRQRRFDLAVERRFSRLAAELEALRLKMIPADDRALRELEQAVQRMTGNGLLAPETAVAMSSFVTLDQRLWKALADLQAHAADRPSITGTPVSSPS